MGGAIKGLIVLLTLPFKLLGLVWSGVSAAGGAAAGLPGVGGLFAFGQGDKERRAQRVAATLIRATVQQGITSRTRDGKLIRVRFLEPLLMTDEELWCPVALPLPDKRSPLDLENEHVIATMEAMCNSKVRVDRLPDGKLCLVARIGAGLDFPEVFTYNAFTLPADAPPLAIPIGLDGYREHKWVDLAGLPHLLGIGATGKGKSNFVHAMICSWIERNGPDSLELWLADHKAGVELGRYQALMQTKTRPGIVRRFSFEPKDTLTLLEAAVKEMDRRLALFRQADCSDLEDYARQTGQYLRRLVVVVDEIFQLMLSREKIDKKYTIGAWADDLLSQIASRGRAAGVHLCIFTQSVDKAVLSRLVRANFESRIVFSLSDQYASIPVLGNQDAKALPKGRAIFRFPGDDQLMVQTPYIPQTQIRLLVNRVSRYGPDGGLGAADEARKFRDDAKLLVQTACDVLDGTFARAKILQLEGIRGVITRERFDQVVQRLEKDGVLEPGGPRRSRRVSKGYHGRAQLLDLLYGPQGENSPAQSDPVDAPAATASTGEDTGEAHQDATNPIPANRPDTGYGTAETPTPTPAPAGDDPDLGAFADFLDELDGDGEK